MKTVELKATFRSKIGKGAVKQVRTLKQIPAVVYGREKKSLPIQVDHKTFEKILNTGAGANVLINLKVAGETSLDERVLIKEIQHDPVTDQIDHVDFHVISLTEKIRVKVHLVTKGEAIGTKEGGILDMVHHEVEIECLPTQIPDKLEADISKMNIGDAIHIRDLTFPEGVASLFPEDEVVITLHAPRAEAEKPAEEEGAKEPEVIAKGKEEVEGAEAAPAEGKEAKKEKPEKPEKAEKAEK